MKIALQLLNHPTKDKSFDKRKRIQGNYLDYEVGKSFGTKALKKAYN